MRLINKPILFLLILLLNFIFLQYISQCVVGASAELGEEEEDAGSVHSSDSRKEGSYRVVGTLKDPTTKPAPYVAEVITVSYGLVVSCITG